MQRFVTFGLCFFSVAVILLADADAFPPIGENQKRYTQDEVTTVKCVIEKVGQVSQVWGPMKGMSYGVNVKVNTGTESLTVYLGPAWFIERQDFKIGVNDTIEVKGCRKIFDGEPVIVAQEIKKGGVVLTLRDKNGFPVWKKAQAEKASYSGGE